MAEIAVKGIIVDQNTFSKIALVDELGNSRGKPPGWGFPGGEGFDEEQAKLALIRETDEETGIPIKILDFIHERRDEFVRGTEVRTLFFLCQALSAGDPVRRVVKETKGWKWFDINDLPKEMYFSHRMVLEGGTGKLKKELDDLLWYRRP